MMELSIIIPAYNCIDTIGTTLDSIIMQEFFVKYEVILVNDCSDYDYSNIIYNYSEKINIREIKTKKNIGPGGARQYGIDNSSSEYIVFIDGDDCFFDRKSLYKMYNEIKTKNNDLVICNFIYEHDDKKIIKKEDFNYLHGKIYRRKFLIDKKIKFNKTRSNEDNGFNMLIFLLKPAFSTLDEVVYIYKENSNSITRKNIRLYDFEGLKGLCYNANWAMEEAIKRKINSFEIGKLALNVLISLYFYYLDLQYEYDVRKILIWSKKIYIKYKNSKYRADKGNLFFLIEINKLFFKEHLNIKEYNISFDDFLRMIDKNNKKL